MSAGVALVVGGSSGIGAAITLRLAKDGFGVALTYQPALKRALSPAQPSPSTAAVSPNCHVKGIST